MSRSSISLFRYLNTGVTSFRSYPNTKTIPGHGNEPFPTGDFIRKAKKKEVENYGLFSDDSPGSDNRIIMNAFIPPLTGVSVLPAGILSLYTTNSSPPSLPSSPPTGLGLPTGPATISNPMQNWPLMPQGWPLPGQITTPFSYLSNSQAVINNSGLPFTQLNDSGIMSLINLAFVRNLTSLSESLGFPSVGDFMLDVAGDSNLLLDCHLNCAPMVKVTVVVRPTPKIKGLLHYESRFIRYDFISNSGNECCQKVVFLETIEALINKTSGFGLISPHFSNALLNKNKVLSSPQITGTCYSAPDKISKRIDCSKAMEFFSDPSTPPPIPAPTNGGGPIGPTRPTNPNSMGSGQVTTDI